MLFSCGVDSTLSFTIAKKFKNGIEIKFDMKGRDPDLEMGDSFRDTAMALDTAFTKIISLGFKHTFQQRDELRLCIF